MVDILETLCRLHGVTGCEDEVRDYIMERVMPYADEIRTDALGNLMVFKKGAVSPARKVALCAHMDEVGLLITYITDDGCLRFDTLGGIDRRVLPGKRVWIGPECVPGVIGVKPIHITTAEQRKELPPLREMYIDVGASNREQAEQIVHPGMSVAFDGEPVRFGDGFLRAKAIDDRTGCAALVSLLEGELACDCWFMFTAQEEVGGRGAAAAAESVRPDVALILESTTAADIPFVDGAERVCRLGQGVVIPYMDRSTIYDRGLYGILGRLAEENGIAWQTKTRIAGGTDASIIQRSGAGVRVAALSVAVRNIHSPACVAKISECEDQTRLAGLFLAEMAASVGDA